MLRTIFLCLLAAASARANSMYNVTIGTTGLTGTSGFLVFDFISGGGPEQNAVSILQFSTDGTFGATSTTGDVILFPPTQYPIGTVLLITDPVNSAFNEYQAAFTFGTTMSFSLSATENAPGPGSAPDELSFFFLASDDATSLIATSDPTSADSLLTLDLDGSTNGIPSVYPATDSSGVSPNMTQGPPPPPIQPSGSAPEPSAWPILAGLSLWGLSRTRARSCTVTPIKG